MLVRATANTVCPLCASVVHIGAIHDHADGVEWSGRACAHFRQFDIHRDADGVLWAVFSAA